MGYTGGESADPTYHRMGDHTEALQIDFDPSRARFEDLLALFWESHRPQRPAHSRQYRAALWYADSEQERLARETAAALERSLGQQVLTAIEPLARFYTAEDYHQKHALRRDAELMAELRDYDDAALRDSTVAARLNGFVSGEGTVELLDAELASYGLSERGRRRLERLFRRMSSSAQTGAHT